MIGLGPILFLIYINDIVDLFSNSDVSTKLFADDIKITACTVVQAVV